MAKRGYGTIMASHKHNLTAIGLALLNFLSPGSNQMQAAEYRRSDVEAQIKHLSSDDESTRKEAIERLGNMKSEAKDAIPKLIEILQSDPSILVRGETAYALGKMGPDSEVAIPQLLRSLKRKEKLQKGYESFEGWERHFAALALGKLGKKPDLVVPALGDALQHDENSEVRENAAEGLKHFGPLAQEAVPALIKAIKEDNERVRYEACHALEEIGGRPEDVPALTGLLSDEIDDARAAGARALGAAGAQAVQAVPNLIKLLNDKNESTRREAAIALGSIGPAAKDAVPALRDALKNEHMHFAAASALKHIEGPPRPEPAQKSDDGSRSRRKEKASEVGSTSHEGEKYGGPMTRYCKQVQSQIRSSWTNDPKLDEPAETTFSVDSNGIISDVASEKTDSGTEEAKAACKRKIEELKKVAAPPSGVKLPLRLTAALCNSADQLSVYWHDTNFQPFMEDLQKQIKSRWSPPKREEDSHIIASFKVWHDGHVTNLRLQQASGSRTTDEAALMAVRHAAPFKELPDGAPENIDVEFKFDYNIMADSQ